MHDTPTPGTDLFRNLTPEKQDKVFQAAVDEFASKGYRSASMNSLIRTAGISKGSLFQYFHSKEDLFAAVVEMAAGRVKRYLKRVRDETAELGFFERLEWLLRAGFAFIDSHPLLAKIYFHLLQSGEAPFGSERIAGLRKQGEEFLAELVVEAQKRGELREPVDAAKVPFLLNALMETLLRAYYTEFLAAGLGLYRGDAGSLDSWVRTTIDLLRNGLEQREFISGNGTYTRREQSL